MVSQSQPAQTHRTHQLEVQDHGASEGSGHTIDRARERYVMFGVHNLNICKSVPPAWCPCFPPLQKEARCPTQPWGPLDTYPNATWRFARSLKVWSPTASSSSRGWLSGSIQCPRSSLPSEFWCQGHLKLIVKDWVSNILQLAALQWASLQNGFKGLAQKSILNQKPLYLNSWSQSSIGSTWIKT